MRSCSPEDPARLKCLTGIMSHACESSFGIQSKKKEIVTI